MLRHLESTTLVAFTEELRQSLPRIVAALDSADRDRTDVAAAQEAHRLIHALKGAASMVGLAALGFLFNLAEELVEGAIDEGAVPPRHVLAILKDSIPQFGQYMDAALEGGSIKAVSLELARALRAAEGAVPDENALNELVEMDTRELASWGPRPGEAIAADANAAESETPSADGAVLDASAHDLAPLDPGAPALADEERALADAFAAWNVGTPEFDGLSDAAAGGEASDVLAAFGLSDIAPMPDADVAVPVEKPARVDPIGAVALGEPAEIAAPPASFDIEVPEAPVEFEAPSAGVDIAPRAPVVTQSRPVVPPAMPAAGPSPSVDDLDLAPAEAIAPELAEVFALEAQEHLETIARLTSQMRTAPEDRDGLQELRRAVHTLKGAAGVVGYKAASKLAHRMEDLLDRLYEGGASVTPEAVHVLTSASDRLSDLINGTGDPDALRAALARMLAEFDVVIGAAAVAAVVPVMPAPKVEQPPAVERRRGGDRRKNADDRRTGGQTLRVPVQRLTDLIRAVSELVINRSTFEQHYAALIEEVDELKFSAARIRKVAQKLESDYEVRALAGNTVSPVSKYGFDELEFDRYTEFHLLTRELTETANDVSTISARISDSIGDFDGDLTRLGRLTREIQDKTMEFRMVTLGTLTSRLERAVRVTAETCGKSVEFAMEGEHVALDKSLLEQMADPLLHLLRNAVDHGIEAPGVRREKAKPEAGRIAIRAYHEGTDVVVEVIDDGAGLDVDRIRRTAVERGLVSEADAAAMAADALYNFIFEPGFSTATQVSEISGRGVGMDVVRSMVVKVNGRIRIESLPGAGTTIALRVPMTLAINRILLVRAGGETFGLPHGAVVQIVRPHPTAISRLGHERVLTLDGRTYPLRDLADTLGLPRTADAHAGQPVLIANLAGRRVALVVDEVLHSRDAVVKTLGTHLRRVPGIWGATLLGDGTVVLILNAADLGGAADEPRVRVAPRPTVAAAERKVYTILIVDDSLSMRHVLSTAVKKAGWNPVQARDGVEALEIIHRSADAPDLILLDIEMPRMDGYEFLGTMRGQPAYADLPIVMLTSRGSEKHREKARALGATDYLVKPFREDSLVATIDRLVRAARQSGRRAAS